MQARVLTRVFMLSLVAALAAFGVMSTTAAASATHLDPTGQTLDLGPFPGDLPANCPFTNGDASVLFLSGNAVVYGNGPNHSGLNVEGPALFQEDGVPLYQGHVHIWFGTNSNLNGQSETGFTLSFHGSGAVGNIQLNGTAHGTINTNGSVTANVLNFSITCS